MKTNTMYYARIAVVSLLFGALSAGPVAAQTTTFRACYVPTVGAIYLIGQTGLPSACLSTSHTEISLPAATARPIVSTAAPTTVSNLGTTAVGLGSVTVTAPTAGTVLVFFSGNVMTYGDGTVVQITLSTTAASASGFATQNIGDLDGAETTQHLRRFGAGITGTVAVSAGTTTIYANALKLSNYSRQAIELDAMRLTAVFIPN